MNRYNFGCKRNCNIDLSETCIKIETKKQLLALVYNCRKSSGIFLLLFLKGIAARFNHFQNCSMNHQGFFFNDLGTSFRNFPSENSIRIFWKKHVSEFHQKFTVNSFQNWTRLCPKNSCWWNSCRNDSGFLIGIWV